METGNYEQVDGTFVYKKGNEIQTTTSEASVKGWELYNKWKDMNSADKKNSVAEWKKTMKKEEGEEILKNVERYYKNDKAEEKGLGEGWMGKDLDKKTQILIELVKDMSDQERRAFLSEIDKAGLASDDLKEKYNELRK